MNELHTNLSANGRGDTRSPNPLLILALCLLLSAACAPKLRHGKVCATDDRCARGLQCLDNRCHTGDDSELTGVSPTFIELKRRVSFPKETENLPNHLISLLRDLSQPLEIEPFVSDPLPSRAELAGGIQIAPAATYKFLQDRVQLVQKVLPNLKLREAKSLKPQQAEGMAQRLGLHSMRGTNGVPVVLGAIAYYGDQQYTIPFFHSVEHVDNALGRAARHMKVHEADGFPVSFACIANAFCPTNEDPPIRNEPGPWPDALAGALSQVREPLDSVRAEIRTDMHRLGLQVDAMSPGDEYDSRPSVLVLANPLRELTQRELEWLNGLREDGTGLVMVIPGARVRATKRQAVAMDAISDQILALFGLSGHHSLVSDRASLVSYRYVAPDGLPGSSPLSADIAKTHPTHPVTAGLHQVNLPLPGALAPPGSDSGAIPIAWSRSATRPVPLPTNLADVASVTNNAPPGSNTPSLMAVAGSDTARWVVVRSNLGLPSMSASVLLGGVDLEGGRPTAQIIARLKAYQNAAQVYARSAQVNRALTRSSLKFLAHAVRWAGESPLTLRLLPESDRPVAKVEEPEPEPAPPESAEGEGEAGGTGEAAPAESH